MHNQHHSSTRFWYRSIVLALLATVMLVALAVPTPRLSVANTTSLQPAAHLPVIKLSRALVPTATPALSATATNTPTATSTASPTPTQMPSNTVDLSGTVFIHPRYRTIPTSRPPHAYVVILDVSASMSWNFAGQGTRNGQDIQCGAPADPSTPRAVCGSESPWRVVNERRIYVAKQAFMALIDLLGPNDTMRLVAYSTSGITTTANRSSDKVALKQAVLALGQYNSDPYWTSSASPNASGLYSARQALAQAPETAPNGEPYSRTAIFLTDSVANRLLAPDGGWLDYSGEDICPNNLFATDTATCMAGYRDDGTPRPITAMVLQGDLLKQISTVYVVGLAGVDNTGLQFIPSASNYPFFSMTMQPANLNPILSDIMNNINYGDCVPRGGDAWIDTIDATRIGDVAPPQGPLIDPTVGYLYLYDQDGNHLPNGRGIVPLHRDPQTDKLSYHVDDLAPGTYRIQAFVAYRGDDDISRLYTHFFERDKQLLSQVSSYTLPLPPSGVPRPADLYLDMDGTVCPTP